MTEPQRTASPDGGIESEAGGVEGRRPTIVDVAAVAGVATATVSRFLNGQPIRGKNQHQIEEAIARLGYRRNALAAAMKGNLTNVVGFMVPALSEFHSAVLEQVSERMHETGRAVLTFCHGANTRDVNQALEFFASHQVDCLLMAGDRGASEGVRNLVRQGTAVILYDNDMEGQAVDRVLVDNRLACFRATSHLLDLGHRRIGIIAGDQRDYTGQERLQGYLDALESRGLARDPAYVMAGDWSINGGNVGLQHLLELPNPPTAVLSCNYGLTYGALTALRERGMKYPDNLSLISFDDVPAFRYGEIGITAISQPVTQIVDALVDLLSRRLERHQDPYPTARIVLQCDFILRGSTRGVNPDGAGSATN